MSQMSVFEAAMWTLAAGFMLLVASFVIPGPAAQAFAAVCAVVHMIASGLIIRHLAFLPMPRFRTRAGLERS